MLLYNNALTKKHQQTSPDHHSTTKIDKKTSKKIKNINFSIFFSFWIIF